MKRGMILAAILAFCGCDSPQPQRVSIVADKNKRYEFAVGTGCPKAFPTGIDYGWPNPGLPEHCWRYDETENYIYRTCRHCRYSERAKKEEYSERMKWKLND